MLNELFVRGVIILEELVGQLLEADWDPKAVKVAEDHQGGQE